MRAFLGGGKALFRSISRTPEVRQALFCPNAPTRFCGARLTTTPAPYLSKMDVVPESIKSSLIVSSYKEELRRRQRVSTAYFDFPLKKMTGEDSGSIQLATSVFKMPIRTDILQRVVLWQRAKRRTLARQVKTRAMVSGGGKKPWKQKGTGRARQGSTRAPQWRHGGKAHGPAQRSFAFGCPKKVRRLAVRTALSTRMAEGRVVVWESDKLDQYKTAQLKSMVEKWGWSDVLLITGPEVDSNMALASRNLYWFDVLPCIGTNVMSILKRRQLVLTRSAVEHLQQHLLRL
eukprot:CAMPEP_0113688336 /NCGR_PEP_ID=MMETSP0038_2-20120614/16466_1 /TAXON_ID=2898 /ORGANISM="Cryptomonas paramecium" /LENGTH=288 /DNA_ID=CAMNT_0000609113 /DNA_START=1 /DNA_END=867 /DNA_ORIENTATION=+ /assembly_acc=CAM_ASM_000170